VPVRPPDPSSRDRRRAGRHVPRRFPETHDERVPQPILNERRFRPPKKERLFERERETDRDARGHLPLSPPRAPFRRRRVRPSVPSSTQLDRPERRLIPRAGGEARRRGARRRWAPRAADEGATKGGAGCSPCGSRRSHRRVHQHPLPRDRVHPASRAAATSPAGTEPGPSPTSREREGDPAHSPKSLIVSGEAASPRGAGWVC